MQYFDLSVILNIEDASGELMATSSSSLNSMLEVSGLMLVDSVE